MAEQHFDDAGNAQVDFVWGNMPMQPNYGRNEYGSWFGGGYMQGDNGWDGTYSETSDTLNTNYTVWLANGWLTSEVGTNHTMVYDGYSNFPGFLPDYAGDEDSDLETTVPKIVGGSRYAAEDALDKAYLDYDWEWRTPSIGYLETDGTTGKAWLYDWSQLIDGLKKDDVLWFDFYDGSSSYSKAITVTSVGTDEYGDAFINFKFQEPIAEYTLDTEIEGTMYAGSEDTYTRVLTMDHPPLEGDIVNEGTGVYFYVLGD